MTRIWPRAALVLATLLATLSFGDAASAAAPVAPAFFGQHLGDPAQVSGIQTPPFPVKTIRLWASHTQWCWLNPAPGVYDWTWLDKWFDVARREGADLVYVFGRVPKWATAGSHAGRGTCSATDASTTEYPDQAAWRSFVTALVTHSDGRIKYYELWNEPNLRAFWSGTLEQLVQMTHDATTIIRRIDPAARIVSPSAIPTFWPDWLQSYLKQVPKGDLDVIAFHAYDALTFRGSPPTPESLLPVIESMRSQMRATGYGSFPLWNTETGWGPNASLPGYPNASVQRAAVARSEILQAQAGVERAYWYAYPDPSWGTLWTPGSGPTAGAQAMAQVMDWLVGATFDGPCRRSSGGVWSCDITRPGGYRAKILWSESGSGEVTVSGYGKIRRLDGTTQVLGARVVVGAEPVLVERTPTPPSLSTSTSTSTSTATSTSTTVPSTTVSSTTGLPALALRASHSSGSSRGWLLAVLVLAILAGAGLFGYRRHHRRRSRIEPPV